MLDATEQIVPDPALADRLSRLEQRLAEKPPTDDQLAQRVIAILAEKAAQQRASNGSAVPGLIPAALMAARTISTVFPDAPPGTAQQPADPGVRTWLIATVSELRLIVRMYFDPRYRLSRLAQFGVPTVLALFLFNYLLFNVLLAIQIPLVFPVCERVGCVVLAVALYKILAREAVRYRQVLDYLGVYGHG